MDGPLRVWRETPPRHHSLSTVLCAWERVKISWRRCRCHRGVHSLGSLEGAEQPWEAAEDYMCLLLGDCETPPRPSDSAWEDGGVAREETSYGQSALRTKTHKQVISRGKPLVCDRAGSDWIRSPSARCAFSSKFQSTALSRLQLLIRIYKFLLHISAFIHNIRPLSGHFIRNKPE